MIRTCLAVKQRSFENEKYRTVISTVSDWTSERQGEGIVRTRSKRAYNQAKILEKRKTKQKAGMILHISMFIQTMTTCVLGAKGSAVKWKWRESTDRSEDNVAVIDGFTGRECRLWVEKQI